VLDIQWDLADNPLKGLINPCNDPQPTEIDVSENEVYRIPQKKGSSKRKIAVLSHQGFETTPNLTAKTVVSTPIG